jgi:hypothetical protein
VTFALSKPPTNKMTTLLVEHMLVEAFDLRCGIQLVSELSLNKVMSWFVVNLSKVLKSILYIDYVIMDCKDLIVRLQDCLVSLLVDIVILQSS